MIAEYFLVCTILIVNVVLFVDGIFRTMSIVKLEEKAERLLNRLKVIEDERKGGSK